MFLILSFYPGGVYIQNLIKMKNVVGFKSRWMVLVGMVFLLQVLGGCQDEELPEGEIRLSEIQDNPDYASLPLIGTQWKLIGFVDGRRERLRLTEPTNENSYTITFLTNGEFSGTTYANGMAGKYEASEIDSSLKILEFGLKSFAGEIHDSPMYTESLKNSSDFNLSPKGLALYYDSQKFMLFKPQ